MLKKLASASAAMALASIVFPVPGAPTNKVPLGILPPSACSFFSILEEWNHLHCLSFGLFYPRHIGQANIWLLLNAAAEASGGAGLDKNQEADQANE